MSEWNEYKLGDCVEMQKGFAFKSSDYMNHGIKIIKVSNLNQKRFDDNSCVFISPILAEQYSRYSLIEDDIIISTVGSWPSNPESVVGKVCRVPKIINGSLLNQNAVRLRVKTNFNQRFIYYILSSSNFSSFIANTAQGSANQASITLDDIRSYIFISPNIKGQEEIVSILSSLDDKIAVNKKICENLEAQAQALFKHWFVDFAPFKNGKFVESELGLIPEGWRVGNLFDVASIYDKIRKPLSGKDREYMNKIYPYYGATSCMDYVDSYLFDGIYTLIGEDGSVVKEDGLPYMQYVWGKFWVNNHAHILQGKNGFSTEMVHVFLSRYNIKHLVTGAVQAKLSQANMQKILLPIPPKDEINKIRPVIDNLYAKKRNCEEESSRLATLRDTLLPKLMSGQIKVNDVNME